MRRIGPPDLNTSARMASGPGAFPHDICLIALAASSSEGGMSRSGGGVESLLHLWTTVSTPSKCSADLSTISFLSVISFVPSTLSMGELLDVSGPYMVSRESKKHFIYVPQYRLQFSNSGDLFIEILKTQRSVCVVYYGTRQSL